MSSAVSSVASTASVDHIMKSLECPVELTPLTTAMHLHPCAHKVNAAALAMLEKQICPVCRAPITASYPDLKIRELVANLKALTQKDRATVLPQVSVKIQTEDAPYKDIPYPGKGAKFTWEGQWEQGFGVDAQHLRLTSRTADRFLDKISVSCRTNGGVEFILDIKKRNPDVFYDRDQEELAKKYFTEVGFPKECISTGIMYHYRMSLLTDRQQIYKILVANNEFTDDVLQILQTLANTKDWRQEQGIPQSFPRND